MTPAEKGRKLHADYIEAAKAYVTAWEPLQAEFEAAVDDALATIRGKNDRRRVAKLARERVRTALRAFGKADPSGPLYATAAELDRCRHALRAHALNASPSTFMES